jgi:hypothetical protein
MSSDERKKIKELRRALLALELQELEHHFSAWNDEPPFVKAAINIEAFNEVRRKQTSLLDEYESRYLIRKAQRWGIEVPYKREWYSTEITNPDPDNMVGEKVTILQDWLNPIGKAVVTKQIRDERFAFWKGWAEILIPILSLTVAIVALLKD